MGQKTHPVQLRARAPYNSQWHSRARYADIVHYEYLLRKRAQRLFQTNIPVGPVYTKWNAKGCNLTLMYLPIENMSYVESTSSKKKITKNSSKIANCVDVLRARNLVPLKQGEMSTAEGYTHPLQARSRAEGWPLRSIDSFSLESAYQNAVTLVSMASLKLEQGVKPRILIDTIISDAQMCQWVQGIKIRVAGRLQGAEIASAQTKQWGQLGLHTLSQRVDYSYSKAVTPAGILGVQIWLSFHREGKLF